MAHFAEIDSNNVVLRVLVVADENEHRGQEFLADDCNLGGTWIQTSYNSNIRGKFAGTNDIYDVEADRFYSPSPYLSWTLNRTSWAWEAPTPYPSGEGIYQWVEEDLNWQLLEPAEDPA
jgi:hypothetical protein